MIIDLHNHTSRYSPCSRISPEILAARNISAGLDGFCITEHDFIWPENEQEDLKSRFTNHIQIFFGAEISTEIGHVLCFGADPGTNFEGTEVNDLFTWPDRNRIALIWAHPFRWNLDWPELINREFLASFDAIELLNGNLSAEEIQFARRRLKPFHVKTTGGSDTHSQNMRLSYGTYFKDNITGQQGLITRLKRGPFEPIELNRL